MEITSVIVIAVASILVLCIIYYMMYSKPAAPVEEPPAPKAEEPPLAPVPAVVTQPEPVVKIVEPPTEKIVLSNDDKKINEMVSVLGLDSRTTGSTTKWLRSLYRSIATRYVDKPEEFIDSKMDKALKMFADRSKRVKRNVMIWLDRARVDILMDGGKYAVLRATDNMVVGIDDDGIVSYYQKPATNEELQKCISDAGVNPYVIVITKHNNRQFGGASTKDSTVVTGLNYEVMIKVGYGYALDNTAMISKDDIVERVDLEISTFQNNYMFHDMVVPILIDGLDINNNGTVDQKEEQAFSPFFDMKSANREYLYSRQ